MKASSNSRQLPVPKPHLTSKPAKKVDAFGLAGEHLHEVLASEVSGREREWANELDAALARVESAMHQQKDAANAPDGTLAEVDETRPTLARQADGLRSNHDELLMQILVLRSEAQRANKEVVDFNEIRARAEQLIAGLRKHKDAETKLVLESINTDIGAGD